MKQNIISISDYESALRGEIANTIYHNPSDAEIKEFEIYISDYLNDMADKNKLPDFTGICMALSDCRHDKFKCCSECGEYFLYEEMNPDDPDYCVNCKAIYNPDWEWELSKEDRED